MPGIRLTQRRVDSLAPRGKVRDVRDSELRGFGVRVMPSGRKSYFLHRQRGGRRVWRTIGDAGAMTESEARARAVAMLAVAGRGGDADAAPAEGALFETVAEEVFRRCRRHWKPGTLEVNLGHYRRCILPWFGGRPVAAVTRSDVRRWFASLHATPGTANRSAPVLSVILGQAEALGHRPEGSNPCIGIKRHRRRGRERFLSPGEIARLSGVLDRHRERRPLEAAAVRLLLLTGCRKTELLTLLWSDFREGRLFLRDGKTGPRTVWLSSAARRVLDGLPRTCRWTFPARTGDRHMSQSVLDKFWQRVRTEAGIDDVRLHDLRHTYASVAMARGETVPTIGRLLGHRRPGTTLRYLHAADAAVREAAEAVAPVLGGRG